MFPLHPETPDEGMLLEDLFNAGPEKITAMVSHLRQTADQLGLEFGARNKTFNSRLAQELGLWAEEQGKGEQFHTAAFRSYFVHGKNLASQEVLLELAREAELSDSDAQDVLNRRSHSGKVDAHWQEARSLGITAVPSFLMGLNRVVGAQSYEILADLVTMAGVSPRNST